MENDSDINVKIPKLPGKFNILRLTLPSGKHDIAIKHFSFYGEEKIRQLLKDVIIKEGERKFITLKTPWEIAIYLPALRPTKAATFLKPFWRSPIVSSSR